MLIKGKGLKGIMAELRSSYIVEGDHAKSDYFGLIKELVAQRRELPANSVAYESLQSKIDQVYKLVLDELRNRQGRPLHPVKFGTSGWRGMIGKDFFVESVARVTTAIVEMYGELDNRPELAAALGVESLDEARRRGCVVGFDNRFGGEILAGRAMDVLTGNGFVVHYAGESTTGVLSAAVLELGAAFSINLTPSHNPLEYAGYKYNAADAGPAAAVLTDRITERVAEIMSSAGTAPLSGNPSLVKPFSAIDAWISLVRSGRERHGLDFDRINSGFVGAENIVVAVDCVHGSSRLHVKSLFKGAPADRLLILRGEADPTFNGIAPEPSSANMQPVLDLLAGRPEAFKLGVVIDPDGDRIRFTDGTCDISMNKFGAMAYHYLHEVKKKKGMVAKTVASSNFANCLAEAFGEEVFEPRVGFKEFKPVLDRALVCFEESDGITIIGHTPEKDAYIGLLLALDMILTLGKNLGDYLRDIENEFGRFFPAKDGVWVSRSGRELQAALTALDRYGVGETIMVGGQERRITRVIAIDGRKMVLADGSWIMIRPSGTEAKVRFYVEARSEKGMGELFAAAREMLAEAGLLG